jgi:hypothetical protein
MRSLLADWMMEVSEEFGLHRETYHVSLNLVDRYLSICSQQSKSVLQLIGVSCLFTTAKIQEIYPPRLLKFAELTDGACTEDAILEKELEILQALDWRVSPMTPVAWLEVGALSVTPTQPTHTPSSHPTSTSRDLSLVSFILRKVKQSLIFVLLQYPIWCSCTSRPIRSQRETRSTCQT